MQNRVTNPLVMAIVITFLINDKQNIREVQVGIADGEQPGARLWRSQAAARSLPAAGLRPKTLNRVAKRTDFPQDKSAAGDVRAADANPGGCYQWAVLFSVRLGLGVPGY